jgi:hypothetical protein
MDFHIVKMYKDKKVNKNVKTYFLSMCDVKVFLTRKDIRPSFLLRGTTPPTNEPRAIEI